MFWPGVPRLSSPKRALRGGRGLCPRGYRPGVRFADRTPNDFAVPPPEHQGQPVHRLVGKLFERWLNGKVEFVANCPLPDFAIDPLLETGYLFHDSDLVVMRPDRPLAGQPDITLADLSRQTRASSGTPGGRWRKVRPVFLAA